ncbi:hypothetical protein BJ170DRAFT_617617 [Xylariales sp. AK1849]|nr:hypothetical protein BJ170DRAFT_617617 [Xylariales sp. AK1849]
MDVERPTVLSVASNGLAMNLPWFPQRILIGATIHSSLLTAKNPFSKMSPFDKESLSHSWLRLDIARGSSGSYISTTTTKKSNTADHLSLSLGVSADVLFASASVTGGYENDVQTNTSGLKSSVRSKYLYGTVQFARPPPLSRTALIALKHPSDYNSGFEEFHSIFGDYYVAGYRLGGEAGMLLTHDTAVINSKEIKYLEAQVKVLCSSEYHRENWITESSSWSDKLNVIGYDTLGYTKYPPVANASQSKGRPHPDEIQMQAVAFGQRVQGLESRVLEAIEAMEMKEEVPYTSDVCDRLCDAGLVMELILLPIKHLREVTKWAMDDNII